MYQYIYKLGHCPDLGVAEFLSVTANPSTKKPLNIDQNPPRFNFQWLMSNTLIDVNSTGSLVFGGSVVESFELDNNQVKEQVILDAIANYLSLNSVKKLGIFVPQVDSKELFKIIKPHCNKITITTKLPNFGHWKLTNNWLILIKFQTVLYLIKLDSYADQEFWTKMDDGLPCADMSRGIINLKLGRSLLNLTNNPNVWDSFAGQGRIIASGMDLKANFLASDNDERVIPDCVKNCNYAEHFWSKNKFNKQDTEVIGQLNSSWIQDASEVNEELETFFGDKTYAIVSEGYLGKNFKNAPDLDKAKEQELKLIELWEKLLVNYANSPVQEIVACLPFYPQINYIPEYKMLSQNPNWQMIKLCKTNFIEYKRDNSLVGHLIFKLVKV